MKDRLITLLGAVLALYLVISLLVPKPPPDTNLSRPTSEDRGSQGLSGLKQWLENANINTYSLRQRYQHLKKIPELSESGNVLIINIPQTISSQHNERKALLSWLEKGNTVVLLSAYSDISTWSNSNYAEINSLPKALGFKLETNVIADEESDTDEEPDVDITNSLQDLKNILDAEITTQQYLPVGKHPVLDKVNAIEVKSNTLLHYDIMPEDNASLIISLARQQETQHPGFLLLQRPSYKTWIFNHGGIFGNQSLAYADNARLFSNILNLSLKNDGSVIFDDMHQGLTNLYDPESFFKDSRFHKTILFMLMLWLLYIIGHTNRFGPATTPKIINNSIAFVTAMGELFARNITVNDVAKRHLEHFNNEYRAKRGMPANGEPVWEYLQSNPAIDKTILKEMQTSFADMDAGKKTDLIIIFNQIQKLRKVLL